jgi:hypothetical protein
MTDGDKVFKCPQCSQWLEAPGDMVGLFVECPKCEAIIKVPASGDEPAETADPGKPLAPTTDHAASEKGSTIRIQLPPNLGIPPAPKRRLILRRPS